MWLPHWSIARRCRRRGPSRFNWRDGRAVVVRDVHLVRSVVDASPGAARHGVRVGMSLAEARAICPGLAQLEFDPAGDSRSLEALGRWMTRFTPDVATGWEADYDEDHVDDLPHALFLDVTGCDRLFGGIDQLVARVGQSLARFRIPARLAVAPTVGAAWALASCDGTGRITRHEELRRALSPLPPSALRLDDGTLDALGHLGIRTVGQLWALPRPQLAARFGPKLLLRLDQATGDRPELLTPLPYQPPVTASVEFDFSVEALDTIWTIVEELLDRVLHDLTRRGLGARRLCLTLQPDRANGRPATVKEISLTRASRDRATLLGLLRETAERLGADGGFVSFRLSVPLHERIAGAEQTAAFGDPDEGGDDVEFDRLLDRLRLRLGEPTVIRPALVESYLPERAWHDGPPTGATLLPGAIRPLCLLPMPAEIRVVCEPSDDRTGSPRQFTDGGGRVHRLRHAVGPERITGEWWRGHDKVRDYYDVEDETGRRFWIFRVVPASLDVAPRWFLHGRFQ